MKNFVQRKDICGGTESDSQMINSINCTLHNDGWFTRKHCQKPWNGKELRYERDVTQMFGQCWLMEGSELREFAEILFDDGRVVFEEEPMQVFRNEFV